MAGDPAAVGLRDRPSARAGFRMELAAAGFGAAVEVRHDYTETHPFERIGGNVCSALSPSRLPAGPGFEDGLRAAIGPGPFEEDVTVSILVAGHTGTMAAVKPAEALIVVDMQRGLPEGPQALPDADR